MPEGNSEYETSDNVTFEEIISGEFSGRVELVGEFDAQRLRLYEQFADIADWMSCGTEGEPVLNIDYARLTDSFRTVIKDTLDDEEDMDTNLGLVVEIIRTDNEERYDEMNEILDDYIFEYFDHDKLEEIIMKLVANGNTYEQSIDNIVRRYVSDLEADIRAFMSLLSEKHGRQMHTHEISADSSGSTLEIKKELKDHVTDVAKIVAGVTIALTLDRLLRRKS